MKNDFDLISWTFPKEITIYPISDVHYGALTHNRESWVKFCRKIEAEDAYLALNGDLINNNTRSACGSPFDDFCRPREQKKKMVEFLKPLKSRILCITSGNHERRSLKDADDDPTYDIACKLDLEDIYRQNAAFMCIGIGEHKHGTKRQPGASVSYGIVCTHGSGGGIYTGATVNRNERWGNVIDGADCVIVGHTHKGTVTRPGKIKFDINNKRVYMTDYLVISSVAWQNYGDYALQKMLLPSQACNPQKLILHDNRNKNIEVRW